MKSQHSRTRAAKRLLAFLLSISMLFTFFVFHDSSPTVMASSIIDPPFSIQSLPSYHEHVQAGNASIQNVTIAAYAAAYGTPAQYSDDYRLRIDTADHLYQFSALCNDPVLRGHYLQKHYLLGNNIEYAAYYTATHNAFVPIGTAGEAGDIPFTGSFDGQGFEIRDLIFVTDKTTVNLNRHFALFGVSSGTIRNFGLVNPVIDTSAVIGGMYVSGIAGKNLSGGVIEFVYVDDTRVYAEGNSPAENPGYRGESAAFAGLVSENQAGATISNAYYSGIVADSACYSGANNIRPAVRTNDGTLTEVYYNKTLYKSGDASATVVVKTSNNRFVTVSAADRELFQVGDVINVGTVPYDDNVIAGLTITTITESGANFKLNFADLVTADIGTYVSTIWAEEAESTPLGTGTGTVRRLGAHSLVTRTNCLPHPNWRTHAYEAIHANGSTHMRSNPKLYGFSGYVSSGWGSAANPLLITTPADLVYFARFFEQGVTNVTSNRAYRLATCIDMSATAPDAYYYTRLPLTAGNATAAFSFSGEIGGGDTCGHTHYETTAGVAPNHAIINLSMTKNLTGFAVTYGVSFPNAEAIGFIPTLGNALNNLTAIQNLNFIGGICRPTLNPSASAIFAGTVAGLSYTPMYNVHSSMDVIIADGATSPFYAGGLMGLTSQIKTNYVSYSGKLSGGVHPYPGKSKAPSIVPETNYTVGGIVGSFSGGGGSTASFTNLLSDGIIEAPGFYDIPLEGGRYLHEDDADLRDGYVAMSPIGVLAGGLFGGYYGIATGNQNSTDQLLLVNRSDLYSVPMASAGTPRTGPSGQRVYSLSPAIGGIQPHGSGFQQTAATYTINFGNIYCYNMIGNASIAGLLGSAARTSHGTITQNVVNYGNITVRNSSGELHASGIQSKVYWNGHNGFESAYNYGNISVDASNSFDTCTVGGIAALGNTLLTTVTFNASDGVYNYGDITVDSVSTACNLYVSGLFACSKLPSIVQVVNAMNSGAIRVNTAQTSGDLVVSGLGQGAFETSANRGSIWVEATGSMSGDILIGGLSATRRGGKFTNSINAGKIEVNAGTTGQIHVGGIYAIDNVTVPADNCLNAGDIRVTNRSGGATVGGIAGSLVNNPVRTITDSINNGTIDVTTPGGIATYTGGIVGFADREFGMFNCINYGAVTSTTTGTGAVLQYTGGIAGRMTQLFDKLDDFNNGAGADGLVNFGAVKAVTAGSNTAGLHTGGVIGSYASGKYFHATNLVNNGSVAQISGAGTNISGSIGSVIGRVDFTGAKPPNQMFFSNHLNTVESLNLYGTHTALDSSTNMALLTRTGLVTVNQSDPYRDGTANAANPMNSLVQYATNDADGIYDQESAIAAELNDGCLAYAERSKLAVPRQVPAFEGGMYALTIRSQESVFLPETLLLNAIDPPSLDREGHLANIKDTAWRTEPCLDFDGTPIPGSSVDNHYALIQQINNSPVILSMSLESTTYYTTCSTCDKRYHADELLHQKGVDIGDMTVEEMTDELGRHAITCTNPDCGSTQYSAVYSEYTIDNIQVRDNKTNTFYFYAAENQIGTTFRIRNWDTNMGTVVADPDTGANVGTLRFPLPDTYDSGTDPATLTQTRTVYLTEPGLEPIEYTVVLNLIPNPKINLVSVTSSRQDSAGNLNGAVSNYPIVYAANLPRDDDGTYVIKQPVYYAAVPNSYLLSFVVATENVAPGYMPRYNTTITHDETGVDYTYDHLRYEMVTDPLTGKKTKQQVGPDKFYASALNKRHTTTSFSNATGTPTYRATAESGHNLYTQRPDVTYPEGSYTIRLYVNNKLMLAIRFTREQNQLGFPVENAYYKVDMDARTAVRADSAYGLSSTPGNFYPLGANNRGSDSILYPAKGTTDRGGSICHEDVRLLVDVQEHIDDAGNLYHTYVNKVAYIPEAGEEYRTWWTVTTHEKLTGKLAIKDLLLNGIKHANGVGFLAETSSDTRVNTITFTGVFTNIDHSNRTNTSKDLYTKFVVEYDDGTTVTELTQVPGSNDYQPSFSFGGKTVLAINQVKGTTSNSPYTPTTDTPSGNYAFTFTLDKDAPQGEYRAYFVYECERQIQIDLFNDGDSTYQEDAYATTVRWHYTFPEPFTIIKPASSDSYLQSINFPGTLLEEIKCTTPGHSHAQTATVSGGVIDYASSPITGADRDTAYDLTLYFPLGVSTTGKQLTLQTSPGATIYRDDGGTWQPVSPQHMVDFEIGASYVYRIESQQGGDYTDYTIKVRALPRNKTLNIEAEAGTGVTSLHDVFESEGEDLLISVKQLSTDEMGISRVYEMYNASYVENSGVHLPFSFPNVSSGTYVIDAHVPPGYGFEVRVGSVKQVLTDNTVAGVKFVIGDLEKDQLVNITVRVNKIANYTRPDGLYVEWPSHHHLVPSDHNDVVFEHNGRLFVDIRPELYPNVILSPRQLLGSEAPGTCFSTGNVIITPDVTIAGDIFAKGDVHVYGTITGDIRSEGNVYVYGTVDGFVIAQGSVETIGGGHITGGASRDD